MFFLALATGCFAYLILAIGLLNQLRPSVLLFPTIIYLTVCLFFLLKNFQSLQPFRLKLKLAKREIFFLVLIGLAFVIHLIGALAPEIFYDALWYHLTLPKFYLLREKIYFIPGNLYFQSTYPRLIEMLYTAALALGNEITAKLIHYLFALLSACLIFKIGRQFFGRFIGLAAVLIFITDLSVGWEATTAYIDLGRAFFEIAALYYFLQWSKKKTNPELLKTGIMLGLAISTKFLALASLLVFAVLTFCLARKEKLKKIINLVWPAIFFSAYWFIDAFIQTGNPVYPLFTDKLHSGHDLVFHPPLNLIIDFFKLSNFPEDWTTPISPLYLISLPLVYSLLKKNKQALILAGYCLLTYLGWFFTPRTGGSRFFLPYLPAFSLLAASVFSLKEKRFRLYQLTAATAVLIVASGNLAVRAYINAKALPYLLSRQSKHQYLVENLSLDNTFLDVDHSFAQQIKADERVLVIGGQNLFYIDFPFSHQSVNDNLDYDYILTQYVDLPEKYGSPELIYTNSQTQVKLYRL